jgi:hypothetical protein
MKPDLVLKNKLFAPTLKGVIDFFRTLYGRGERKKSSCYGGIT